MRVRGVVSFVAVCGLVGLLGCGGDDDGNGGGGGGTGAPPMCGNGVREGAEVCDGDDLGMATCADLNQGSGVLKCNRMTCQFDVTMCGTIPGGMTGTSGTGG